MDKRQGPHGNSLDRQVGGQHYKRLAIEPIVYAQLNSLGACEFNVLKYITRHRGKDGEQDLLKAIHCLEILIELEYRQPVRRRCVSGRLKRRRRRRPAAR